LPRLTIDGREVELPEGATVLDGARELGIDVPTICHSDGAEPYASCFLCVVAVEGRSELVPACATPVGDGMRVSTGSEDIEGARRAALDLLLSDHVGDCEAPCTVGCPAGMNIPEMIRLIAAGRQDEAARVARERIPLSASLGRVCPRFCERVCRRGELDAPVNICELKRFAGEAGLADGFSEQPGADTGKSVAVVGAGPAGLTCAYHLRRTGHAVTVFEAEDEPGGAFRYAIPEFRLSAATAVAEAESIVRLGAEIKTGMRLGEDVSLKKLSKEFDAVFIATGAPVAVPAQMRGAKHAVSALEFLRAVGRGEPPSADEVGDVVVVIGADTACLDAARTARRLGASRVYVLWEGEPKKMPAPDHLLRAAEAERVEVASETGELLIREDDDNAADGGLVVARRAHPHADPIAASYVIAGGGRKADTALAESEGLAVSPRGVEADRRTCATGLKGVFAGGEAVTGPGAGVRAVAAGRRAAVSIDQFLRGDEVTGEGKEFNSRIGRLEGAERAAVLFGARTAERISGAKLAAADRPGAFAEVDLGLTADEARAEAGRCLDCDCTKKSACRLRDLASAHGAAQGRFKGERRSFVRDTTHEEIVHEPGKCILCGICVRVASEAHEARGITFLKRGFAVKVGGAFEDSIAEALKAAPLECAAACPTGAIALKRAGAPPAPSGPPPPPPAPAPAPEREPA